MISPFSLILRHHVASTVDSKQSKITFKLLVIATDLFVSHGKGRPIVLSSPVEIVDPSFGADGWHRAVFVAGEVHHADWLVLESLICPLGCIGAHRVGESRLALYGAHEPDLRVLDIQLRANCVVIEVLSRRHRIDARRNSIVIVFLIEILRHALQPGRVFLGRVELVVFMFNPVDFDFAK